MGDDDPIGTVDLVLVPNLTHGARPRLLAGNLVVAPEHRRRGVATALLAAAVSHAEANACYEIQLLSDGRRTTAHPLFEAAGFTANATGHTRRL
ncbi:hypothetical protein GCM10010468_30900 [Actinocorallia longicatena]|uniref:N-acetyltransferase domain-containing protein n=1 Tax=Actinocorallia longicatena TaxID=111803 RepID=A0ABP6Q8N5_9ACTN